MPFTIREVVLKYSGVKKEIKSAVIMNHEDVAEFLEGLVIDNPFEKFIVIYLNNSNRVLGYSEQKGHLGKCDVPFRRITAAIMRLNAASVIVAHSHPSGTTRFSEQDLLITKKIATFLNLIDVFLLDHVLLPLGKRPVSMRAGSTKKYLEGDLFKAK